MVLVAFALFGLMALAALTVDLGRARAVQVDLQVAADRGALEAIRQRDVADDAFRRQRARDAAAETDDGSQVPPPALNPTNDPRGDLLALATDPTSGAVTPTPLGDAAAAQAADQFAVRLRRDPTPSADTTISAPGPAVPWLFAHGSAIGHRDALGRPTRERGLLVRGEARAAVRPALRVGTSHPGVEGFLTLGGGLGLALDAAVWAAPAWVAGGDQTVDVDAGGEVRQAGALVGRLIGSAGRRVGAALPADPPDPLPAAVPAQTGFVALSTAIPDLGGPRVIGFARVDWAGAVPGTLTLTKRAGAVAPRNASAHARGALAWSPDLSAARDALVDAVLAPALVE